MIFEMKFLIFFFEKSALMIVYVVNDTNINFTCSKVRFVYRMPWWHLLFVMRCCGTVMTFEDFIGNLTKYQQTFVFISRSSFSFSFSLLGFFRFVSKFCHRLTANNYVINMLPNPYPAGAEQYGSRAGTPLSAFTVGSGWTPNVDVQWGDGFETYVSWPLNPSKTMSTKVAQLDFDHGANFNITLTADAGYFTSVKSVRFIVWPGGESRAQIQWTVFANNQMKTGTSSIIGKSG